MLEKQLQIIRSSNRISSSDVIRGVFTNFIEIHGDRVLGDDLTLTAGIALLEKVPVTILAVNRGRTIKERQKFNGGQVHVSGYRKALRAVEAAEKFGRPVISIIDMPGADASIDSENHGQSQAIADLISKMGALKVPNLALFIGEGHSGGALALANVNRILMLENALFSVASPEAVAAIVTTDKDVSEFLPMTAAQLAQIGINDDTIIEDDNLVKQIKKSLSNQIQELKQLNKKQIVDNRTQKFERVIDTWNQ